jgi:hypothetical protein
MTSAGREEEEEKSVRKFTLITLVIVCMIGGVSAAQPGALLGKFAAPNDVYGLAVVGNSLWGATFLDSPPLLYEFDFKTGKVLSSLQHGYTFPFGLGFDSIRNEFVLTSASQGTVARVNKSGTVTTVFPVPTSGSVGVAHDANRDAYWVADWSADRLYLMDAKNGSTLQAPFDLKPSGCTRASDVAFSAENDLVIVVDRDSEAAYLFRAGDPPVLRRVVSLKPLAIRSGAKGAAIEPRTQTFFTDGTSTPFEIYRVDLGLPRVAAADTVKVGQTLPIGWTATASPSLSYQAAAAFSEGRAIRFGMRYVPLLPDDLFWLSLGTPTIFNRFAGLLDPNGTAIGSVNVPSIPALAGIKFSIAFVTASPQGIQDISGAWPVTIQK